MDASINQLADWTGLDRRTIRKRLEPLPSKPGPNRALLFDSRAALRLLLGAATDGERLDPQTERALLDRERRRAVEMANDEKAGKLIDADEVAAAWEHQVGIAKGRLLAMPTRLAPAVLRAKDLREIEQTLRDAVLTVLDEPSAEAATSE